MRFRFSFLCIPIALLAACAPAPPPPAPAASATPAPAPAPGPTPAPTTDAGMIASAMAAAPEAVSKDATVVTMDEKMQMRTLRAGTNGWTCMPDLPTSPGTDPMCVDKNGMEWVGALMAHKDPPKNPMAIGYMLMGGSDASNTDPFAQEPKEGQAWVDTGPHLMVLNIGDRFAGYPTQSGNTKIPYVMFPNTPYAHLMIPVK